MPENPVLDITHLTRSIQTLESSLALYHAAQPDSIEQEVFRNAVIKGYELVQEAAFNVLRRALREFNHAPRKLAATPVKDILRLAATHGLLTAEDVDRWFEYRDNRNETAHQYGLHFAENTLVLLPRFIEDSRDLEARLLQLAQQG